MSVKFKMSRNDHNPVVHCDVYNRVIFSVSVKLSFCVSVLKILLESSAILGGSKRPRGFIQFARLFGRSFLSENRKSKRKCTCCTMSDDDCGDETTPGAARGFPVATETRRIGRRGGVRSDSDNRFSKFIEY